MRRVHSHITLANYRFARPAMNFTSDPAAVTHFLEAAYDLEQPRAKWFRGTLRAASLAFERGAGVGMMLYDVSGDAPRVDAHDGVNVQPGNIAMSLELHRRPDLTRAILEGYRNHVCVTM